MLLLAIVFGAVHQLGMGAKVGPVNAPPPRDGGEHAQRSYQGSYHLLGNKENKVEDAHAGPAHYCFTIHRVINTMTVTGTLGNSSSSSLSFRKKFIIDIHTFTLKKTRTRRSPSATN